MRRGEFKKIVPVQFENGHLLERTDLWPWLFRQLPALPPGMSAYGYSYQNHGLFGASPEMLFESDGRGYRTMALAGTRPADRAPELLRDAKELREHRMVVDDIVRRIAPFANVEVEAIRILELPGIAHLATPIRFEEIGFERMSFAEIIRRLHPTAALGVWPRSEAGERLTRVEEGHDAVDLAVGENLVADDAPCEPRQVSVHVHAGTLVSLPADVDPVLHDQARFDRGRLTGPLQEELQPVSGKARRCDRDRVPRNPGLGRSVPAVPMTVALPESASLVRDRERPGASRADHHRVHRLHA